MKTIVIGVMPQDKIRARAIAIAKGEYKPRPGEPKIWFTSMRSVAEVLSDSNRALLKDPGDRPAVHGGAGTGHGPAAEQPLSHAQDDGAVRPGFIAP